MIWASKDVYQLQYLMIITRAIDNFTVGEFFDSAQSSSVKNFKIRLQVAYTQSKNCSWNRFFSQRTA